MGSNAPRILSAICGVMVFVLIADVVVGRIESNGGSSVVTWNTGTDRPYRFEWWKKE
jgi:hypothetical protein